MGSKHSSKNRKESRSSSESRVGSFDNNGSQRPAKKLFRRQDTPRVADDDLDIINSEATSCKNKSRAGHHGRPSRLAMNQMMPPSISIECPADDSGNYRKSVIKPLKCWWALIIWPMGKSTISDDWTVISVVHFCTVSKVFEKPYSTKVLLFSFSAFPRYYEINANTIQWLDSIRLQQFGYRSWRRYTHSRRICTVPQCLHTPS